MFSVYAGAPQTRSPRGTFLQPLLLLRCSVSQEPEWEDLEDPEEPEEPKDPEDSEEPEDPEDPEDPEEPEEDPKDSEGV